MSSRCLAPVVQTLLSLCLGQLVICPKVLLFLLLLKVEVRRGHEINGQWTVFTSITWPNHLTNCGYLAARAMNRVHACRAAARSH